MSSRAARRRPSRWRRSAQGDDGFSLLETLVSLGIISVVMVSLAPFLIGSVVATRKQAGVQAATQFAVGAMERVSQLPGSALIRGRERQPVLDQWRAPGVDAYLDPTKTELVWDLSGSPTQPAQSLPTTPQTVDIDGVASKFMRSWYVGACWQPHGTGECVVVPPAQRASQIAMYRVVVAISWSSSDCPNSVCSFVTAVLLGRDLNDPIFS